MKVSIEVSDLLLQKAGELATREGKTLDELIETGLRMVIERDERIEEFHLRDASVGGRGLRQGLSYDDWGRILEISSRRSR